MSANNFLSVEANNGKWEVWLRDVESSQGNLRKTFSDKLEAIDYAQEIQDDEIIEYGISITNAPTIIPKK